MFDRESHICDKDKNHKVSKWIHHAQLTEDFEKEIFCNWILVTWYRSKRPFLKVKMKIEMKFSNFYDDFL